MAEVRITAPAKVNLRLRILGRETHGFHSLESVFCALSLADECVVAGAGPGIALTVEGEMERGAPEQNLAVRAAQSFYAELGERPAIRILLRKRLPSAAGLGGGSSDAAAVLRALDALHGRPLAADRLLELGSALGSDVPFFLCGSPLALAWGRGERLLALPPLPPRPVLVAHPGVPMPTREAFDRLAERRGAGYQVPASALGLASLASWPAVAGIVGNDFEPVAEALIPGFAAAREAIQGAGASIAMLAGSGSCVFGVFDDPARRDFAAGVLHERGWRVWPAWTLQAMPPPQVDPAPESG